MSDATEEQGQSDQTDNAVSSVRDRFDWEIDGWKFKARPPKFREMSRLRELVTRAGAQMSTLSRDEMFELMKEGISAIYGENSKECAAMIARLEELCEIARDESATPAARAAARHEVYIAERLCSRHYEPFAAAVADNAYTEETMRYCAAKLLLVRIEDPSGEVYSTQSGVMPDAHLAAAPDDAIYRSGLRCLALFSPSEPQIKN